MAIDNIDNLDLGTLLQIIFSDGVRTQISEDYRDWEMVSSMRQSDSAARELRFQFLSGFGPSAVQYRKPGQSGRKFPSSQQSKIAEHTALFKEINATIELEYNLWDRARKSPEKYAEPLALEIQSKTTGSKRRLAADYYLDGTGVMGEVTDASAQLSISGTEITAALDTADSSRGHVGSFEYDDIYLARLTDGTAPAATTFTVGGTDVAYLVVTDRDRDTDEVKFDSYDSSDNLLTGALVAAAAPYHFYRWEQPTIPDVTSNATIGDFGSATEVIAGLESLTADDGRTIHDIVMSGATKGTRVDAGNNPLDVTYIQKALDNVKTAVGQGKYSYKMMCMSPEAHAALIESRETDRRFNTVEDNKKGIKYFAYQHGNDSVETYTSEYCPKKRIYIKPEAKNKEKVLEYWGSDFETVKAQGMGDFHLKPHVDGGYENTIVSFLSAIGVLVCKHPRSIAVVRNFTL